MIKVTFKTPQKIQQDGIVSDCLFVYCFKVVEFAANIYHRLYFTDEENPDFANKDKCKLIRYSLIQSIEHVKPTEL